MQSEPVDPRLKFKVKIALVVLCLGGVIGGVIWEVERYRIARQQRTDEMLREERIRRSKPQRLTALGIELPPGPETSPLPRQELLGMTFETVTLVRDTLVDCELMSVKDAVLTPVAAAQKHLAVLTAELDGGAGQSAASTLTVGGREWHIVTRTRPNPARDLPRQPVDKLCNESDIGLGWHDHRPLGRPSRADAERQRDSLRADCRRKNQRYADLVELSRTADVKDDAAFTVVGTRLAVVRCSAIGADDADTFDTWVKRLGPMRPLE
jgi:hypothetical protein